MRDLIQRTIHLILALLVASLAGGCGAEEADAASSASGLPRPGDREPMIRVLLGDDLAEAAIGSDVAVVIDGLDDRPAVRVVFPGDGPLRLTRDSNTWRLGDGTFVGKEITLTPADDDAALRFGERAYRGRLRLVPGDRGTFDVVNDLGVEAYLAGVLPGELPSDWDETTFAAQAVVARTYALFEAKTAGASRGHFDVYDDDRSQVYKGAIAESRKSRGAAARTRGEVVTQETPQGPRIFKAYFHSTSGGATIGADAAFNDPPSAALSARSTGDLSRASSRFEWDPIVIKKPELTRRFHAWGARSNHPIARMSTLAEIEVADRSPQGRPTRYEVVDAVNRKFSLTPEQLRWAINTDRGSAAGVLSGWFRPESNPDNIAFFDGRGWGHGVGMCQWSAEAMAQRGDDYRSIVTTSYPETRIYRAY